MMFHNVLRVFHDVLLVVHDDLRCITMFYMCFMMFSESRNDRRRRIGDRAAADRLRDRGNSAGIVVIAANVIPC